jgi:hypothetical protein
MRPDGERCHFTEREQERFDLPESWHVSELHNELPNLSRRRDGWYEAAYTPTPFNGERGQRYTLVEQANDLGMLIRQLTEHVPPIVADEADLFLRNLGQS